MTSTSASNKGKKMNINVQVLSSACDQYKMFEIDHIDIYAQDRNYERVFYCKKLELCKNAVSLWDKQNETGETE